jgi:hypothetical protein
MATATDPNAVAPATGNLPITPDWQLQADRTIAGQAAGQYATPYQTYSGPTIAGLTADQQTANQNVRNNVAGTTLDPNAVQDNISYGLSGFDPNQVAKYASPFTSGVVDEIGRLGNKNLMQSVLPQVNSTFQGAGQFGSTRNGDFTNTAIQNNDYNTLGQQSQALQAAQQAGLNAYTQWHQNAIPNAQAATTLSNQNIGALGQVGSQQQALDQASLTQAKTDFTNQNDYAKNQLDWYSNISRGNVAPTGSVATTYNNTTPPSPIMQGLKAASDIYGNFGK